MLEPKIINTDAGEEKYHRLLGGPPDTVSMRSGKVVLQPNETVGVHSTGSYEELIIVLLGEGRFLIENGPELDLKPNTAAYCPPNTTHNIKNTGSNPLHYIYVVAKAYL